MKKRHNITFSEETWDTLIKLKEIKGESISHIIEDAIKEYITSKGYNTVYFKIMAHPKYLSEKENEEITQHLDNIDPEDLEIGEEYEI